MLLLLKLFFTLRYFLYSVPLRILGGGPRIIRIWPSNSIFSDLWLDLDFAYWMVGKEAPISGGPFREWMRPRLRWFLGFDRAAQKR
jgi:hypothetical protein